MEKILKVKSLILILTVVMSAVLFGTVVVQAEGTFRPDTSSGSLDDWGISDTTNFGEHFSLAIPGTETFTTFYTISPVSTRTDNFPKGSFIIDAIPEGTYITGFTIDVTRNLYNTQPPNVTTEKLKIYVSDAIDGQYIELALDSERRTNNFVTGNEWDHSSVWVNRLKYKIPQGRKYKFIKIEYDKSLYMTRRVCNYSIAYEDDPDAAVKEEPEAPVITPEYTVTFTDIDKSHWAYGSILKLAELGIVNGGSDGRVNPDDNITTEEVCAVLARHLGLKESDTALELVNTDSTVSEWAKAEVAAIVNAKILKYDAENSALNGNVNASRELSFVMLARAFEISSNEAELPFTDADKISAWAVDSIKGLYANGNISGYEDGTINPKGNITRAEFFTMLDRLMPNNK